MPTILTSPVVTRPRAAAPRWPLSPLLAPSPARSSRAPKAPGPERGHDPGRPGHRRPQRGAGDVGRPLEQGHRVAGVVGALPARDETETVADGEHAVRLRRDGAGRGDALPPRGSRTAAHDAGMGA